MVSKCFATGQYRAGRLVICKVLKTRIWGVPPPAWAVGSYSSGPPAGRTPQILVFKTLQMTSRPALYTLCHIHTGFSQSAIPRLGKLAPGAGQRQVHATCRNENFAEPCTCTAQFLPQCRNENVFLIIISSLRNFSNHDEARCVNRVSFQTLPF